MFFHDFSIFYSCHLKAKKYTANIHSSLGFSSTMFLNPNLLIKMTSKDIALLGEVLTNTEKIEQRQIHMTVRQHGIIFILVQVLYVQEFLI